MGEREIKAKKNRQKGQEGGSLKEEDIRSKPKAIWQKVYSSK